MHLYNRRSRGHGEQGRILKVSEQSDRRSIQPSSRSAPEARSRMRVYLVAALASFTAGGSWWLMRPGAIDCNALAPLTVLATLAAFLISMCFRLMGRYADRRSRWLLCACVLIAAATLFTDFRFVRRYRGFCNDLRQQMHHTPGSQ
jgi:uncharacterized membrane protein